MDNEKELFRKAVQEEFNALREKYNLSKAELARRINKPPKYIYDLENKRRGSIKVHELVYIIEAIGNGETCEKFRQNVDARLKNISHD